MKNFKTLMIFKCNNMNIKKQIKRIIWSSIFIYITAPVLLLIGSFIKRGMISLYNNFMRSFEVYNFEIDLSSISVRRKLIILLMIYGTHRFWCKMLGLGFGINEEYKKGFLNGVKKEIGIFIIFLYFLALLWVLIIHLFTPLFETVLGLKGYGGFFYLIAFAAISVCSLFCAALTEE